MTILSSAQLDTQRRQLIKHMMPDTCRIYPRTPMGATVNPAGVVVTGTVAAREWRGSTDIPCRMDFGRAFRPARLDAQETVADEYIIVLPFDVTVEQGDRIEVLGATYEIRKQRNVTQWDIAQEYTLSKLGVNSNV